MDDATPTATETPAHTGPVDTAWGTHLVETHDGLRTDLAALRTHVAAYVAAQGPGVPRTPPPLGVQLRTRCLTFCGAVHDHHSHEDAEGFPFVASQVPELAPTIERLRREHVVVAEVLDGIRELLGDDEAVMRTDPAKLQAGLDELAERLLAHLAYEEEQLIDALNELGERMAPIMAAQAAAQAQGGTAPAGQAPATSA